MDAQEAIEKKVKEPPPVPIKTYQWEDIRRARRRGGYPWTYLDKRPFDDNNLDDFKVYTMDALRKTKSSTDMDTNGVTIEEHADDNKNNPEPNVENVMIESTSSADVSISQYLDKDDKDSPDVPGTSSTKTETLRSQRAKSEEPGRKRKHSIESSYSRISKYSLSKMGFIKKLKETKDKIKLPKFSFTKSDSRLNKKSEKEPEKPKATTSKNEKVQPKKIEGPLYIHIPLKPPPGETDEFSYLEFEDQKDKGRDVSPIVEEAKEETPVETASGVQLIILTAPSDDEILDTPAVAETPLEVDKTFFDEKKGIDDLKNLARNVVDKYSPETKRKVINPVQEEEEPAAEKEESKVDIPQEVEIVERVSEIKEESVSEKPPMVPAEEKSTKKKKKVKKEKSKDKTKENAKDGEKDVGVKVEEKDIIETQKTDDDKIEEQKVQMQTVVEKQETKLTVDEEDGLKTETVIAQMIAEDIKEIEKAESPTKEVITEDPQLAKTEPVVKEAKVKESPLLKKKVSFKRRSKDDNDGIYEDVQVTTEPVQVPTEAKSSTEEDNFTAPSPTPNLLIDEQMTKIHEQRVKGMSIAEEYEYWCRVNCHDYEPINPPDDGFRTIAQGEETLPKKPSTPVTDSDIEFLAARAADIELRTTGIITITNKEDPSEALFVPLESALKADAQSTKSEKEGKEEGHGKKISDAIQKQASNLKRQASIISKKAGDQAEKIQTRVKSIKKPKIKMPSKPKFEKPNLPKLKIEKPNLSKLKIERPKMPNVKIPERMKNISLSLPRKGKHSARRPTSTESTAGDSEKRTVFDFSTYPRIFKKKKRADDGEEIHTPRTGTDVTPVSERTTLPRFKFTTRWKGKFIEKSSAPPPSSTTIDTVNSLRSKDSERSETQGSVRIPLHSEDSMDRESLDLRTAEERDRDYREDSVERRMRLASTRYDNDIEMDDAYMKENQEIHRASSLNAKYNDRWNHGTFHENEPTPTMSEVHEQKPASILKKKIEHIHAGSSDDIHRRGVLEEINSDEFFLRQKGISQDNIEVGAYLSSEIREAFRTPSNALSQLEAVQPEAPKRRPLKKPKRKKTPHVSQEGIQYDQESVHSGPDEYPRYQEDFETPSQPERPKRRSKKKDVLDMKYIEDQILSHEDYLEQNKEFMYENEHMKGIEQPDINICDAYQMEHSYPDDERLPAPPPRKHRSERSLNAMSEHDSITGELNGYKEIQEEENQLEHEYQIPTPDQPPKRPFRTRSRTRSGSRGTALPDEETLSRSILSSSQQSLTYKSKICEPPLPPCRRRSLKSEGAEEERFFTVPRSSSQQQPMRPLRNYSTLGPSRPPRKQSVPNLTDEEKHTGGPYIEIEDDEHTKNLQSSNVIKKMKDRPLPAPPRPPRKSRDRSRGSRKSDKSLERDRDLDVEEPHEFEASVQTEPLPDDFECAELVRDEDDRVITPTVHKYAAVTKPKHMKEFDHQETITHGSLVVQPFKHDEQIPEGPIEMFSRSTERIITVRKETGSDVDYDETSEIPEEFKYLKSPAGDDGQQAPTQVIERIIEKHIPIQLEAPGEVETLRAQKLQVGDLDVDRLAVNELHASKIKVGEIDSSAINVQEINSSSGNLVVSGIELPASFFQQLVEKLQEQADHVATTRAVPPVESPPPVAKVVETKEMETNTESETLTHSEINLPTQSHTEFTDEHDYVFESTEPATFREEIGQAIDEVINEAQATVAHDYDERVSGQKKNSV